MAKLTTTGRWTQSAATGVAVFALTFLASFISGTIFLSPSTSNAETKKSNVSVSVPTTLAISTDASGNTVSIPVTPTSTGTSATAVLNVDVSTNNLTGYTLSVGSNTNNTALIHTVDNTATIASTTATTTAPTAIPTNHWGYSNWTDTQITNSTAPTTYYRIPGTTTDTLRTTVEPLAHSISRLSFATKVDTTIPAGTYAHTLTFTATSNYVPDPPACPVIGGKNYLQEVESPSSTHYGRAGQRVVLKDRRNGQEYYAQNIINQDGTCTAWMETNLRYAGYDGTSEQWNAAWGWDDDRYATSTTLAASTQNPNDNTRPLTMTTSGYFGGSTTNGYTVAGVANAGGSTDYTNTAASGGFYGYLYNWCSAMGGQPNACNNTETNQANLDTTRSICPAGWRLPTGGTAANTDFKNLNNAVNAGSTTSPQGLIDNFLAVYSGYYASGLNYQGSYGDYWSSSVYSAANAYNLTFSAAYVYPGTYGNPKYFGRSVRCVI